MSNSQLTATLLLEAPLTRATEQSQPEQTARANQTPTGVIQREEMGIVSYPRMEQYISSLEPTPLPPLSLIPSCTSLSINGGCAAGTIAVNSLLAVQPASLIAVQPASLTAVLSMAVLMPLPFPFPISGIDIEPVLDQHAGELPASAPIIPAEIDNTTIGEIVETITTELQESVARSADGLELLLACFAQVPTVQIREREVAAREREREEENQEVRQEAGKGAELALANPHCLGIYTLNDSSGFGQPDDVVSAEGADNCVGSPVEQCTTESGGLLIPQTLIVRELSSGWVQQWSLDWASHRNQFYRLLDVEWANQDVPVKFWPVADCTYWVNQPAHSVYEVGNNCHQLEQLPPGFDLALLWENSVLLDQQPPCLD